MALNVDQFTDEHLVPLAALVGEPIVSQEDTDTARACLAVAWENVKAAGAGSWTLEKAPALAITILLSAAQRAWMNLGGYTEERADAVSLSRSPEFAAGAELTPLERQKLGDLVGRSATKGTLRSEAITAMTTTDRNLIEETPWWNRNVMVYGPTMNPSTALPIPYLPGDEIRTAQAGDVGPYQVGHYSTGWPFTQRAPRWRW